MNISAPGYFDDPLTLRRNAIDAYRENLAYLHRDCAICRTEGFQALSKEEVRGSGHRIAETNEISKLYVES